MHREIFLTQCKIRDGHPSRAIKSFDFSNLMMRF